MVKSPAIQWPVIVKYYADPELAYARTADECAQFLANADNRTIVIDSAGIVFKSGELLSQAVDLIELNDWVREHAMAHDQCCIAKLHVRNATDAITFVAQLDAMQ